MAKPVSVEQSRAIPVTPEEGITDVTGPMAMLVDRIDGRWTFCPQGTGDRRDLGVDPAP